MKCSIIIINYNYGRFLKDSIESCLNQTYNNVETIVVDDGSTDNSRDVIDNYGNSIIKIFQSNHGMIEASNAGFSKAKGDVIIFLDADDYLYEDTIEKIVNKWNSKISKVHFKLNIINSNGVVSGIFPVSNLMLDEGEVWQIILKNGFYITTPMSGNAFSKQVLDKFFPIMDATIGSGSNYYDKIPTDAYLKLKVPFYGDVLAIQEPLGAYRIHGKNNGAIKSPYFDFRKRYRVLTLLKSDAVFIKNWLNRKNINWDEDNLFRKSKLLKLRLISRRFDGSNHPWSDDTRLSILIMGLKFFIKLRIKDYFRGIYNLIILSLVAILSRQNTFKLLNKLYRLKVK